MNRLEHVTLSLDEYEAVRLVDRDGLDQAAAAAHLGVSRATCARILENAHTKVADALTRGKAIVIQGGNFDFRQTRLLCDNCGHTWEISGEADIEETSSSCPSCGGGTISDLSLRYRPRQHRGGGHGRGRGGNMF